MELSRQRGRLRQRRAHNGCLIIVNLCCLQYPRHHEHYHHLYHRRRQRWDVVTAGAAPGASFTGVSGVVVDGCTISSSSSLERCSRGSRWGASIAGVPSLKRCTRYHDPENYHFWVDDCYRTPFSPSLHSSDPLFFFLDSSRMKITISRPCAFWRWEWEEHHSAHRAAS